MNQKLVTTLIALGMISVGGPVFAATSADDTTTTTTTSTATSSTSTDAASSATPKMVTKKHVRHYHHHYHHYYHPAMAPMPVAAAAPEMMAHPDYKGMMPDVCTVSPNTMVMHSMTQNVGRSMPNPCNTDWFKRVQLSGGLNVDVGKWGNRDGNYMGENYRRLSLNDIYVNLGADVNDWTKAFVSISYNTATVNEFNEDVDVFPIAEYSSAYDDNVRSGASHSLQVEQAFATMGNFDVSPIFLQVGKQFEDFGRYEIHPITRSLTQVMSETLATSANLGFITNGFNGSVYVFDDPINKAGHGSSPTNYGAALGYAQADPQLGWDVGAGWMYNLMGVNDVAYTVNQFNSLLGFSGYQSRVGAASLYGDINSGPFSVGARYVAALERFNTLDLPENSLTSLFNPNPEGAKPWAAGIQAGFGFDAWDKSQNVYLGYQASREAPGLALPRSRWLAGYDIDMWKNTGFGIEWDHDRAYSVADGGTGGNTNLVSLRANVKFA